MSSAAYQKNKRTRAEKHLLVRAIAVGTFLTAVVCLLDQFGALSSIGIENFFYDQRVRLCQFFRPLPTDKIVHIDIDDGAIETIGRWPWKRSLLADVVDELSLARAKVTAFDIILSESQEPTRDEKGVATDHDEILAEAIRRAGNVLVPTSLMLEKPVEETDQIKAAEEWLSLHLGWSREELNERLATQSIPPIGPDDYVHALRTAMQKRVQTELSPFQPWGNDRLVETLLPDIARQGKNAPAVQYLKQAISVVEVV